MRPSLPVPAFWQRAAMERAELYATLSTGSLGAATEQLVDLIASTLARRGRVLLCGNGGSAMAAQHAAAEWIGRFSTNRPEAPAPRSVAHEFENSIRPPLLESKLFAEHDPDASQNATHLAHLRVPALLESGRRRRSKARPTRR